MKSDYNSINRTEKAKELRKLSDAEILAALPVAKKERQMSAIYAEAGSYNRPAREQMRMNQAKSDAAWISMTLEVIAETRGIIPASPSIKVL
jgi:hypothetical protein